MTDAPAPASDCPICRKPAALCVCDSVTPVENSKVSLLILQHPQEQDRALGTARLTAHSLTNAELRVGLSWPNLGKILGRAVDPQRWAVLYLGSVDAARVAPGRELVLVDRKGEADPNQDAGLRQLEGIVLLDGTWSQAKALWWRNPWMLKLRRLVLNPKTPSRYGKVRREPRRDALSTVEAAALLLARLEGKPEIETTLTDTFERMLAKFRASGIKLQRAPDRRRHRGSPRPPRR
jgi:DTW domain-containing protein YfiP